MRHRTLQAMLRALMALGISLACGAASAVNVVGSKTANLSWSAASGPVAGYGVFVALNGAPYPASPNFTTTSTTGQVTGAYGDSFTVKVAAYTASGTYGPFSPDSAAIQFVPLPPAIALSTTSLSAAAQAGSNPQSGSFLIHNSGGGALSYSFTTNQSWVSVSPSSGTSNGENDPITVNFNAAGLAAGAYTAAITASATGTASQTIGVTLTVTAVNTPPPPQIALSTNSVSASAVAGASPSSQSFTVRNSGGGTLSFAVSDNQSWLSVTPTSSTSSGGADTITVNFSTAGLAPGTYTATITVSGNGLTQTIPVSVTVSSATTTNLLVGFGTGSGGVLSVVGQGFPFSATSSMTRAWAGYNSSGGETRPAACDLYGDGRHEFVVGFGQGGGGWLEVLDSADRGFAHLAWIQVNYPAYNASNGETFPACGDIDGDGRDEIVVGFGTGGDGWIAIFDDATTGYAPMPGTPVAGGWLQVQWPDYDVSNGATHPAVGDFDGDGMAEIAVGLGTGSFGFIQVFDDQAHGFAPMTEVSHGWIAPSWPSYDSANGDSYLAACDLDGDGKAELVVGHGTGSSGWVQILDDATTGFAQRSGPGGSWIQTNWGGYNASNGTTHPSCADVNGDGKPDIVLGLGDGGYGWMQIFENTSSGFVPMANTPKGSGWILVAPASGLSGPGATWPGLVH
ncbi:MAG TPA: FG-GAP-like repeat-containing protein [Myxococcota bacterium]|nr:FG-GAP-like repeat-containing protein [Myxococcota bacterium]